MIGISLTICNVAAQLILCASNGLWWISWFLRAPPSHLLQNLQSHGGQFAHSGREKLSPFKLEVSQYLASDGLSRTRAMASVKVRNLSIPSSFHMLGAEAARQSRRHHEQMVGFLNARISWDEIYFAVELSSEIMGLPLTSTRKILLHKLVFLLSFCPATKTRKFGHSTRISDG